MQIENVETHSMSEQTHPPSTIDLLAQVGHVFLA